MFAVSALVLVVTATVRVLRRRGVSR